MIRSFIRLYHYSITKEVMENYTVELAEGLLAGKRHSLAKSITLVESSNPNHMQQASLLLTFVLENKNKKKKQQTIRIGIAGPPGAGKSTFIDRIGKQILSEPKNKNKIAVIPIDPSSHVSGGDNTRMEYLSRSENAYVRASPTRGVLGGIAEHTTDVISLCEAAGYNIIIVESVGLGQSEVDIDRAVDMMILLLAPGAGDSLQASKKGIMEAADMIVVNKCDGDLQTSAQHTAADYSGSLQFIKQKYNINSNNNNNNNTIIKKNNLEETQLKPRVYLVSSLTGKNISELINEIYKYHSLMCSNGQIITKRNIQSKFWMREHIKRTIISQIINNKSIQRRINECDKLLDNNIVNSRSAANSIIDLINIKVSTNENNVDMK